MKKIYICILLLSPFILNAQTITPQAKARAAELVAQMTLEEKIDYIGGHNSFYIRGIERLGIPEIRMADGPQGVRNNTKSTMYACGMAAAASWNREAVYNMGIGLGQDARARGVHILLGPGVNIYRSPLCGRNFEYFGEDPYLTAQTTVQYIKGVQSQGVIATVKHFAANNQEWDRHHVSSDIDTRTLHEIYLPAFLAAVREAGVGAVMSSYNPLNCVHTTEHRELIVDILREMWGFEGIFMSDWNATYSTVGPANNGLDLEMPSGRFMNKEMLLPVIKAGLVSEKMIDLKVQHILQTLIAFGFFERPQLDKSIPEKNAFSDKAALQLAREGSVLLKNDGILPVRKGKVLVMGPGADTIFTGGGSGFVHPFKTVSIADGMLEMGKQYKVTSIVPQTNYDLNAADLFVAPGSSERGLKAEYFKNRTLEGVPAVSRTETNIKYNWGRKAPMSGMPADGFSIRWSGVLRPSADKIMRIKVGGDDGYRLLLDGKQIAEDWGLHRSTYREVELELKAGREYRLTMEYYEDTNYAEAEIGYEFLDKQAERKAIESADAVILCMGFNSATEKENADRTFGLPDGQEEFIKNVASINPNVVVVLTSGGGVDFAPWGDKARAILMAWYPGQEGGKALSEIITGKISPSGKLPISIEKRWEDNPAFSSYYPNQLNDYRSETLKRVNYNEGVFIGYRGYDRSGIAPLYPFGFGMSYSTFTYSALQVSGSGSDLTVSFDVKNTGSMDAAEVAQVYVTDVKASVPRPAKELKGYEKVFLKKGETKRISVKLNDQSLSFFDVFTNKFVVEKGEFTISVGGSSADLPLRKTVIL